MSKGYRRPLSPVMRRIDDAIDYLETRGKSVNVATVTDNAAGRIPARTLTDYIETLLRPLSRTRLVARGYVVSDAEDYERTELSGMTATSFDEAVLVKERNVKAVSDRLDADKAVRDFLKAKSQAEGREVTVAEFADEVADLYESHGIAVTV